MRGCGVVGGSWSWASECAASTIAINAKQSLTVIAISDNLPGVELRQLASFVAVAEEGSFTRAADRLHVVQSAVSAGVRNLEKRARRDAVRPLHAQRQADRRRARAAARGARHAGRGASGARRRRRGRAAACAARSCSASMQAQGMRAINLAARAGGVPRRAPRESRSRSATRRLAARWPERSATAASTSRSSRFPADAPPGSKLIPLASEPIMLAVPAGHPLARRAGVELASLREETMVDLPPGWGIRMAVDRSFAAAGATRDDRLRGQRHRERWSSSSATPSRSGCCPHRWSRPSDGIAFVPIRDHPPQFRPRSRPRQTAG